jgi:hypothetical protein
MGLNPWPPTTMHHVLPMSYKLVCDKVVNIVIVILVYLPHNNLKCVDSFLNASKIIL